ncbi:MAG: class I SAM-dependent methyltransferase [Chthonomonadales bacterium]
MLPTSLQKDEPEDDETRRKRSEMTARDEQAGDYDRMWHLKLFGMLEIPATLAGLHLTPESLLLEGGCGTGRMTSDFAARCQELVSVDFSWESLLSCQRKLKAAGIKNVHLIQADLCSLPLRTEMFDSVVSCQVLEHIPSADARSRAVSDLARVCKNGGHVVISAYQHSIFTRIFGEKEGEHAGGIYFFRFFRAEFRELLAKHLKVNGITGALVYHFIGRCRKCEDGK